MLAKALMGIGGTEGFPTSKPALRSPACEKLVKLQPRGPRRPLCSPTGHPDPTDPDAGHDLTDIMFTSSFRL